MEGKNGGMEGKKMKRWRRCVVRDDLAVALSATMMGVVRDRWLIGDSQAKGRTCDEGSWQKDGGVVPPREATTQKSHDAKPEGWFWLVARCARRWLGNPRVDGSGVQVGGDLSLQGCDALLDCGLSRVEVERTLVVRQRLVHVA